MDDVAQQIQEEQWSQIRHEAVPVPDRRNPFLNKEMEAEFFHLLQEIVEAGIMPVGYGLFPDEWEDDTYPLFETLQMGKRRGGRTVQVSLAAPIWRERAVLWAQAVNLLYRFNQ